MPLRSHYHESAVKVLPAACAWNPHSVDYLSRLLSLGWIRRDSPSESPNLTPMGSQYDVEIIVFPETGESEGSDGSVKAQVDESLPYSIISTTMLNRVHVKYSQCQIKTLKGSKNTTYTQMGKVELRWHKKEKGKSYPQTFYVVEQATSLVILGAPAFGSGNQSSGGGVYPIGLQQQTAA